MKLYLSMLEKYVQLPSADAAEIRKHLDDLGLEVKDLVTDGGQTTFNIESLANRGDHLYAAGVAREFSARFLTPLRQPAGASELPERKASAIIRRETPLCPRYALGELVLAPDFKVRADVAQIMASVPGERPPIVDYLNYIQLEIGQPMHAFDKEKIEGGEIIIDQTQKEEEIVALDGKTYRVPPHSIVIRDRKKIVAVAGVIGCANSMCDAKTQRVLIESALFDPVAVRKTARAMGLSTDASYAFERGVDPESPVPAIRRLLALAGGADGKTAQLVGLSVSEGELPARRQITVGLQYIRRHMNAPRLDELEVTSRLKNLGFQPTVQERGKERDLLLTVPSWRCWDIANEDDIVEEVARAIGLGKVKIVLPPFDQEIKPVSAFEQLLFTLEPALLGNGFFEVITKGFYSAEDVGLLERLDLGVGAKHVLVKNAVESAYSHMKITNALHLAKLALQNERRGNLSCKVYEVGRQFALTPESKQGHEFEWDTLTLGVSGRWANAEWRKPESAEELLFSVKGVLGAIADALGTELTTTESAQPMLHPGCQAAVKFGRNIVGFFGLLHPELAERIELRAPFVYAELDMGLLQRVRQRPLVVASEFPAVRRDLTLKIPLRSMAGRVLRHIDELKRENLLNVAIVDEFRKADEEFRRVTFRLTFQRVDRTLENAEVDLDVQEILKVLSSAHQISLVA